MARSIKITAGEVAAQAELNDSAMADAIWEACPIRSTVKTWGDEISFDTPVAVEGDDLQPTVEEHQGNLELLREISPDLLARLGAGKLDPATLEGRAAFRCTTPDYLPLIGPLAERKAFSAAYAVLGKDARQVPDVACPWLEGLYLNSAHGSRGLITAPLSGELLAAWIEGEPLPLPRKVAEACLPNRFLLREVVRGQKA